MFRHLPLERIQDSLASDWNLTQDAVEIKRQQYGRNDIVEKVSGTWLHLLRDTLLDPMIWFLFVTGLLFLWLAQYHEALILWLAIIPIGGMDAYLHWRTQVSTQALSTKLVTYANVIRDGKTLVIAASELVPGDLVILKSGDYFPADGILLKTTNVQVDESSLTGEAFPVTKKPLVSLDPHQVNPLVSYQHWGMVGTHLLTGEALLRVVYTGKETLYGEIISSVLETQHQKTPLQYALSRLVMNLIVVATAFCLLLAVVRLYQGFGIMDAILSAATLAVAALPDEYPMVFTFFLGVGVYRLAKKHALVRRGVSVENIGRVTTICTDKTGTVTEGRFVVASLYPSDKVDSSILLNSARLASRRDSRDPLDEAIFNAENSEAYTKMVPEKLLHTYPFTEERKRETAIYAVGDGVMSVTKGTPEIVLAMSQLDAQQLDYWQHKVIDLARAGYKVIGCARLKSSSMLETESDSGYEWLGLLAFIDPPRKEVYQAIQYCQSNHLHVLMITGDHPETARTIAADIGLGNGAPNVITALEAEEILQSRGGEFLRNVHVIARAVPAQKFSIVTALRALHEVVVVTGDGVNDVPALRAADIGIAMGERGTQSAREAASIVLLDDNFGSIVNAIREGKQLFKNLQQSFKYILMIHMPYVLSATLIPLFGFPLLYYPIQIVCIELFIHPTCMLVFQDLPDDRQVSTTRERRSDVAFFSRYDLWGICLVGVYTTLLTIVAYLICLKVSGNPAAARADAFIAVGLSHVAITIGLSRLRSWTAKIVVFASVALLLVLVQIPSVSHYFNMQPPLLMTWMWLTVASVVTALMAWKFS